MVQYIIVNKYKLKSVDEINSNSKSSFRGIRISIQYSLFSLKKKYQWKVRDKFN